MTLRKEIPELKEPNLELKVLEYMSKKSYNQACDDIKERIKDALGQDATFYLRADLDNLIKELS